MQRQCDVESSLKPEQSAPAVANPRSSPSGQTARLIRVCSSEIEIRHTLEKQVRLIL